MSVIGRSGILPRMQPLAAHRPAVVSVLDVGSSKVCCLIARLTPREESAVLPGRSHSVDIIGYGHQRSRGVKAGVVVDLDAAEHAIRLAVDAAERMAGLTVESLIVNLSSGRLHSEALSADVALHGQQVEEGDIGRVLRAGAEHALAPERSVVHAIPINYALDSERGVADPRGLIGEKLGVAMHVVTGENGPIRNLELCINRAHLSVEAMVATPYASGLAALVDDEAQLGSACIDMGGSTTTLSVFMDGRFVTCDAIAIGGQHATQDIARTLGIRLDDAEKLKILHGSALIGGEDAIPVPGIADEPDGARQTSRSELVRIIRPRIEETLELICNRLARSGFAGVVGKRIVLTGGASQLNGVADLARRIFGKDVRLGRPMGIAGAPERARGAAFATASGLLIYPQHAHLERFSSGSSTGAWRMTGTGPLARIGAWLRDSL